MPAGTTPRWPAHGVHAQGRAGAAGTGAGAQVRRLGHPQVTGKAGSSKMPWPGETGSPKRVGSGSCSAVCASCCDD